MVFHCIQNACAKLSLTSLSPELHLHICDPLTVTVRKIRHKVNNLNTWARKKQSWISFPKSTLLIRIGVWAASLILTLRVSLYHYFAWAGGRGQTLFLFKVLNSPSVLILTIFVAAVIGPSDCFKDADNYWRLGSGTVSLVFSKDS